MSYVWYIELAGGQSAVWQLKKKVPIQPLILYSVGISWHPAFCLPWDLIKISIKCKLYNTIFRWQDRGVLCLNFPRNHLIKFLVHTHDFTDKLPSQDLVSLGNKEKCIPDYYISICLFIKPPFRSLPSSSACWTPGKCRCLEDSRNDKSRILWTSSSFWRHHLLDSGILPPLWSWSGVCSTDRLCRHRRTWVCTAWCWNSLIAQSASTVGP